MGKLLKYSDKYKWLECVKNAGSLTLGSAQSLTWICRRPECRKRYNRTVKKQQHGYCGESCAQSHEPDPNQMSQSLKDVSNLLNESPMAAWLATATSHTAQLTVGSHEDVDWKCVGCGKIYSRKICYQTNGLCGRHCAQRNRQAGANPNPICCLPIQVGSYPGTYPGTLSRHLRH